MNTIFVSSLKVLKITNKEILEFCHIAHLGMIIDAEIGMLISMALSIRLSLIYFSLYLVKIFIMAFHNASHYGAKYIQKNIMEHIALTFTQLQEEEH